MTDTPLRPPLGRVPRTVITVLLVIAVMIPALLIRDLIAARTGLAPLADAGAVVVPMAVLAWLAPRVSYRRRDALLWPVGVGGYVFLVIAWRLAYLPYRDWPPRPDEAAHARWLPDPRYAGLWHLAGFTPRRGWREAPSTPAAPPR
ncbi:hypothetical protein [Micromonospora inositola]|uniref:Uncharacterized protein n=1 Tax=Micromonospora inositola TaxID=47865 RepID=A0A1C5HJ62_9ACTN|nr:hypothetical protein [Micromonospora inositola]SCG46072.1 hypothetical protein GA0070613_1410 [Micromonospora inositola]